MKHIELIEKVARALCEAQGGEWRSGTMETINLKDLASPHQYDLDQLNNRYRFMAQAAISTILTALQEPTEGMIEAGAGPAVFQGAAHCWRAMLAASALGEQAE